MKITRMGGILLVVVSILFASCTPKTEPGVLIEKDYIAEHPDWTPVGAEYQKEGKVTWDDVEIPLKLSFTTALDPDSCHRVGSISLELMQEVDVEIVETRVEGFSIDCGMDMYGDDERRHQVLSVAADLKSCKGTGKGIQFVDLNGLGEVKFD